LTEPIEKPRLADTIAERLKALVLEGALRPGERLIEEPALARTFGVSRSTVRDALGILEAKGLLVAGKTGYCVAPFLSGFADPLTELLRDDDRASADYFEFRLILETDAAGLAALRATETDRARIRDCLDRMREAHELNDPSVEVEFDIRLHLAIYEATHNVVILHVLRTLAELMRKGAFVNKENLYRRVGVRDRLRLQYVKIGEAVLARDRRLAEAAAEEHVNFVREAYAAMLLDELRQAATLRRFSREDIVAE